MPNASTTQVSSASDTTGTPIPLSYGYVWATGKRAAYYMTQDTNNTNTDYWRVGIWLLGHGEWDGCNELWINDQLIWTSENDNPAQFHFHRGADAVIGTGMFPESQEPDQGVDDFWPVFPPAINPLHYNRIAYYSIFRKQPIENQTNDHQGDPTQWADINPIGLWRALRTRLFDDQGRMTAYAFNTNPAWHFVDALLRRKIMPDYNIDLNNGPDDLTTAVQARFNWESIYESAQYFDQFLANGRRRFSGSYSFATQTTLQAVLEQILLCCRSYMQEYAGQIYLICDMPRPSVFDFSRQHILPGSWEASDRNTHTRANRYIGAFRDLLIPAASNIESITCANHDALPVVAFEQPHPFNTGDYVVIGGTNTIYDGQWIVYAVPDVINAGTTSEVDPTTLQLTSKGSNYPATVGAGGSMGLMYSRFANRTPEFWHKKNQLARGAVGNGIPRWWNRVKQELDFATCTYDQVSRITRYERDRQLGLDQTPYVTPPNVSFRTSMFAKDAYGNLACAVQPGDHVTIDNTLNYPYAGDYEVLEPLTVYPPAVQPSQTPAGLQLTPVPGSGEIEFTLGPYNEAVMYDSSDDLQAGWPSVPNSDPGNESDYIGIPLANDGMLAFFAGSLQSGQTFQLPATGFNPSNVMAWAGPQGYIETGNVMHVISLCDVSTALLLTLNYEDGEGHIWQGDTNFACVTWRSEDVPTVSGAWTWIQLTLANGEIITFGKAVVSDGTTIPLPSGFTAAQSFAVAFPHNASPSEPGASGNEAHGVAAYVDSSQVVHLNYQDGESHVWHGNASVLVFAWQNNMGTVTLETNGAATWALFPVATAAPAATAFKVGFARLNNGATLPTVGGDETAYMQPIVSPSSFTIVDHPAHGVGACYLDANDNVVVTFDDGAGDIWSGGGDVFAVLPVTLVNVQPAPPPNRTIIPPVSTAPQIVLDPNFLDGTQEWTLGAGWDTTTYPGRATLTDVTVASQCETTTQFPVTPGDNYQLAANLASPNPADPAAGSGNCFLNFYSASGALLSTVSGSVVTAALATGGGFTSLIQGTLAPPTAAYCLAGVVVNPPSAGVSTGTWSAQSVYGQQALLTNASGLTYISGNTVDSLKPAQAGADVTGANTALNTANVGSQTAAQVVAGVENAATALANAATAQTAANSANTLLSTITGTSVLMPGQKSALIADYNALIAAQSANDTQAALLGISSTTYDTALSTLTSYLGTLTSPVAWNVLTNYTTINGTTLSNDFEAAYAAQSALLNAIRAAINTTANTGVENAATAQAAATAAQTAANSANTLLGTITGTSVLMPGQKSALIADYNALIAAQSANDAQAALLGISSTTYDTALSTLTSYLGTLTSPVAWNVLTNYTTINGTTLSNDFEAAYAAQSALLSAIYAAVNTIANSANSGVLLQNPNFAAGNTGWTVQAGWSIAETPANYVGNSSYVACWNGSGTSALANMQQIPCAAGNVVAAGNFIMAADSGCNGSLTLQILFHNSSGSAILTVTSANASVAAWTAYRVVGTAPAGTAFATVRCVMSGASSSDTWAVCGFTAALQANSLAEVPDSSTRFAAIESYSDQTINHFQTIEGTFPSSAVTLPAGVKVTLGTVAIQASSTEDIFTFLVFAGDNIPTLLGNIGANVDGGATFGMSGGLSPFVGVVTGLSAGAHTVNITFSPTSSGSGTCVANAYVLLCQQICSAAGGLVNAPAGGVKLTPAYVSS